MEELLQEQPALLHEEEEVCTEQDPKPELDPLLDPELIVPEQVLEELLQEQPAAKLHEKEEVNAEQVPLDPELIVPEQVLELLLQVQPETAWQLLANPS